MLARSQTTADDEQELADLISDLNAHIAKSKAERRTAWFFWLLKAPVRAFEGYHGSPSAVNSLIETVEVILKGKTSRPQGAIAVFHDARKRVIEPSSAQTGRWSIVEKITAG